MTSAGHRSDNELTKDTPCLTFTGEVWGVFVSILERKYPVIRSLDCNTLTIMSILSHYLDPFIWSGPISEAGTIMYPPLLYMI